MVSRLDAIGVGLIATVAIIAVAIGIRVIVVVAISIVTITVVAIVIVVTITTGLGTIITAAIFITTLVEAGVIVVWVLIVLVVVGIGFLIRKALLQCVKVAFHISKRFRLNTQVGLVKVTLPVNGHSLIEDTLAFLISEPGSLVWSIWQLLGKVLTGLEQSEEVLGSISLGFLTERR